METTCPTAGRLTWDRPQGLESHVQIQIPNLPEDTRLIVTTLFIEEKKKTENNPNVH